MNKNKFNSNGPETINHLAGAIQDMWHYAALIKPPPDGRISTFVGAREYNGVIGMCKAYEALISKIAAWQMEYLPDFCELDLKENSEITTIAQMIEQVGYYITAINAVALANNIDGYSGNFKYEYILTDGDEERERVMLTKDDAEELNRKVKIQTAGTLWYALNVSGRAGSQSRSNP